MALKPVETGAGGTVAKLDPANPLAQDAARRVAFLGPMGTFTERAARAMGGEQLQPYDETENALMAVAEQRAAAAVIPWVNSRAGAVEASFAAVRKFHPHLKAVKAHALRIRFRLYRHREDRTPLTTVAGHPAALTQCADHIARAGVRAVPVASNGVALQAAAQGGTPGLGALGPPDLAGYQILTCDPDPWEDGEAATLFLWLRLGKPGATGCLMLFDREEEMLKAAKTGGWGTVSAWSGSVGCVLYPRPLSRQPGAVIVGLNDAESFRTAFPA